MEYYLGLLLVLVGVLVLVWVFVRPRRGDEPHCRKCNFNLVGLKEPARCPECGRDLAGPRAMVRGQRPSPKRGLCWFVGIALMGGAFVGLDAMNRTGFFSLNTHKPAALLQAEAYLLEDLRASRATDELVDRITRGAIGVEARDRLVRTALARHAQTWRGFPDAQWVVICNAMGRNELSFEQIERLWNDSFVDVRLMKVNSLNGPLAPEEAIDVVVGLNFRAGVTRPGAMGNSGLVYRMDIDVVMRDEHDIEIKTGDHDPFGRIVQIPQATTVSKEMHEVISFNAHAMSTLGAQFGEVRVELEFLSEIVASQWPGIDAEKLERLATLNHVYTFPFEIEVVEAETLIPPVVEPSSLSADPSSLIQFTPVNIYSHAETGKDPGIMYRVGTTELLDPSIGLSGHIVFTQGDLVVRSIATYYKPHSTTQNYMPLAGFVSGPVQVSYQNAPDLARSNRGRMTSVLGGPIELGTITIPEPEPEPEPE